MGKCKVNTNWLKRTDSNGTLVSKYAVIESQHSVLCTSCSTTINCSKGFQAIADHSKTPKHVRNIKDKFDPNQLHLESRQGRNCVPVPDDEGSSAVSGIQGWQMSCLKDESVKAELLWALNIVATNSSSSSCSNVTQLFHAMFPNMPPDFTMGKTKVSYYITEALGPYFRKQLLSDLINSYYSIEFDESPSNGGMKECQISVRFWSEQENAVVSRFLESFFIGHATAEDLLGWILKAINNANLPLSKMLMLGSDGPNVNKKVLRLLNEAVMSTLSRDNKKSLLEIGTCNLHIVHNAFEKGVRELGQRAQDFFINTYYYFKNYPSRKEDFSKSQIETDTPQHELIKFVSSRWLTLGPVAERIQEQFPALRHYFLEVIDKKASKKTKEDEKLRKIIQDLKDPILLAEIIFLAESTKPFERFSKLFQEEEPVVHILYEECRRLLILLISKICTSDTVRNFDKILDPFAVDQMKPVGSLRFGDEIEKILSKKSLSGKDVLLFRQSARQHIKSAAQHLLNKSILQWRDAKHLRFLQPDYIAKQGSSHSVMTINRALPLKICESELLDEWTLLRIDKLPERQTNERVDHYWSKIFAMMDGSGDAKYPLVRKLVKASLSLVHGSADVERRFNDSGNQLTEDRSCMSEHTLNARMVVKDALKKFDNQPHRVMITQEMIAMGRSAHSAYKAHQEEKAKAEAERLAKKKEEEEEAELQRKLLEEQEKKREDLVKLEEKLKEAKKEEKNCDNAREKLIEEAIAKLETAVKRKDLTEVKIAEGLLRGAQTLKSQSKDCDVKKLNREVLKRKSSLISGFFKRSRTEEG